MKVTIYGAGSVGLVTGACLAQVGNDVLCVDTDERVIQMLSDGDIPMYEPGLNKIIEENKAAGRLNFTGSAEDGAKHGLVQFIAVNTPPDEDGSVDITHVLSAAKSIAENLTSYCIIVNHSTVPVGTADIVRTTIQEALDKRGVTTKYDIVSNPEFLKEGNAIDDFRKPDRIILGVDNEQAFNVMHELYLPFNRNHECIITMDVRSAELTKYATNALLATKISFMNELSNIADIVGADIENVRIGIGSDPRIGYHFIYPGCGYGGSYFPKDIQALERTAKENGYDAELLSAVEAVNHRQKNKPVEKLLAHYKGDLTGKKVALWGLAFRPNADDMREASSRVTMEALWAEGAEVQAFDPVATDECRRIYGDDKEGLTYCNSAEDALVGADCLVIVTEWQQFRSPDFDFIKSSLKDPVIVDGRNIYDPEVMRRLGFSYYSIGRNKPAST